MTLRFSKRSLDKLKGVHPDLVKVFEIAIKITKQDFSITQGVRTLTEQRKLVAQKKSQTLNSKHLVQQDGYGHAVDVVPYPVDWELEKFYPIAEAVKKAAEELGIKVRWGGAWILLNNQTLTPKQLVEEYSKARRKVGNKVFIDAPHFEILTN